MQKRLRTLTPRCKTLISKKQEKNPTPNEEQDDEVGCNMYGESEGRSVGWGIFRIENLISFHIRVPLPRFNHDIS